MNTIISFFRDYVAWLTIPEFTITDALEILIMLLLSIILFFGLRTRGHGCC